MAELVTDGLTVFANLPEGVYDFDTTPAIAIDTNRSKDKNCVQIMSGQDLYFKNKKALNHYDISTGGISAAGYDQEDGLPSEQWGEITAMVSTWKNIFAAVKGATYSHILSKDMSNVWQYYARIPTAGLWVNKLFMSDAPDAIDRLWVIFGNYNNPGYFLNPMVNPIQAATYSYVATGHIGFPIFDGGISEQSGGFYNLSLTADGMGGSNIITSIYGVNGAIPAATLGVTATNSLPLTFGSPAGIEGYRIQPKFILAGANSGTSPLFREAALDYLKLPVTRESFDFTIDLMKTSNPMRPVEAIIGSLSFEKDSRTLLPFHYGQIATRQVKVLDAPAVEDTEEQIFESERTGFQRVRVAEIL